MVGPLGAERIADALRKGGAPRLRELDLTANTLGLCVCVCLSVYVSECLFSRKLNPNSPTHTHTHTHTHAGNYGVTCITQALPYCISLVSLQLGTRMMMK